MSINWESQLGVQITTLAEATQTIGDSDNYYVYIIWKMYTETPVPFYVGKGHWQRLIKHGMKSDRNSNPYKINVFDKHTRLGISCGYSIYNFFNDEFDALEKEKEIIALIGRSDLKHGPLTNKTDGGDGSLGHLALRGGDSHSARPVIANSKKYDCLKDAGEALNVNPGSISSRIKNGWEGYYYEDEGQLPQSKEILGRYRKAVVVQNREFISASDAARELGLDVRMISKRINYGWEGYYYLDQGQLQRKTIWSDRKDKVAVCIRGKKYPTVAEAVRDMGESMAKISKRCLSSNFIEYSRLDGKVLKRENPPRFPEKILVESKSFESLGKAAEFFDLTDGGVAYRCKSENYPEWRFANTNKQDLESFIPEFSSIQIPVTIDGKVYESQSAGALEYQIDINTLKKRCRSFSFPKWICDNYPKIKPKDGRLGLIGITIQGKNYRSISKASAELGIGRSTIKLRLDSVEWPDYCLEQ